LTKLETKRVLLQWQREEVLSKKTDYKKNKQLFKFLLNKKYTVDFNEVLHALKETDQEFVVNFITASGGKVT
jgi:hypothetical protein